MAKFHKRLYRLVIYLECDDYFHCLVYLPRRAISHLEKDFTHFFSKENLIKTASHMIDLYPNTVITVSAYYLGDRFGKYDLEYCSFFNENATDLEFSVLKDFANAGLKLSPIEHEDFVLLTKPSVGEKSLDEI